MTIKQYMKFEDFKREFLLEAKKGRFPVGIYWSFHKDPKDEENKKKGIVDFYIALDNKIDDKLKEKHNKAIDEIIKKIKEGRDGIKFHNDTIEQIKYEFENEYSLKRITIPFTFDSNLSETEDLNKIKDFVKTTLKPYTQNIKVYTSTELTDRSNKSFTEQSDAQEKAIEYIDDMINHPEKFGGYKTISQHLDDIKDMSTMEFVHKYASDGPIAAFLAKQIFNLWNYARDRAHDKEIKKTHPPKWNNNLKNFTTIQNKKAKINLSPCIEHYDIHKDDIEIILSPESPDYKMNGSDFEYQFKEQKEYSITFTLKSKKKKFDEDSKDIKINVTIPKWNNKLPTEKTWQNDKLFTIDLISAIDNYNLLDKDDIELSVDPNTTDEDNLCTIDGTIFKFKKHEGNYPVTLTISSKSNAFEKQSKDILINIKKLEVIKP